MKHMLIIIQKTRLSTIMDKKYSGLMIMCILSQLILKIMINHLPRTLKFKQLGIQAISHRQGRIIVDKWIVWIYTRLLFKTLRLFPKKETSKLLSKRVRIVWIVIWDIIHLIRVLI